MTRMFTAAAIAALMAGSALAQTPPTSSSMAEPMPKSQDANVSTSNPETGDAMISADGRVVEPEGSMAAPMADPMAAPAPMADAMASGMAAPAPMADSTATASMAAPMPMGASVSTQTVTNGPVPDTAENRAKYGGPMSRAGKRTDPAGN